MNVSRSVIVVLLASAVSWVCRTDGETGRARAAEGQESAAGRLFTDSFRVENAEWSSRGSNPYFLLEPGTVLVLEGKDEGENVKLTITVLDQTKQVAGVETRVVEEREEKGGELIEVSRNFFAISQKTSSVYYFGEEVDMYEGGKVSGHGGSWSAGENGARFGLMLPGTPLLGARYFQEIAPGVAMDRAEIVSLSATLDTPTGKFENCLKVEETTPLEKGREFKVYAYGIGLVNDAELRLSRFVAAKK